MSDSKTIYVTFFLALTVVAAIVTHIISCINHEQWLFLIAGAVASPIGIIHGIGLWFGAF